MPASSWTAPALEPLSSGAGLCEPCWLLAAGCCLLAEDTHQRRHHRPSDPHWCYPKFQCTCPAGPCSLKVEVPSCAVGPLRSAEDLTPELLPGKDATSATVTTGVPIKAATTAQTSIPTSPSAVLPRR